jgi:hypothetical protein
MEEFYLFLFTVQTLALVATAVADWRRLEP